MRPWSDTEKYGYCSTAKVKGQSLKGFCLVAYGFSLIKLNKCPSDANINHTAMFVLLDVNVKVKVKQLNVFFLFKKTSLVT